LYIIVYVCIESYLKQNHKINWFAKHIHNSGVLLKKTNIEILAKAIHTVNMY